MKEKMKVVWKKLKNILPLLLACLLVGAMVLGLYVFSQSKQMNTLSASAEEASTVADVESGLDLTQYPSANLYRYSVAREYHNLSPGTKVENVGSFGFDCKGKVSSGPYTGIFDNGWFRAGGEYKVLPVLPAVEVGQQVNVSFDLTLYETIPEYTSFSLGTYLLFDTLYNGDTSKSVRLLNNTEKQSFTVSFVIPEKYSGQYPYVVITLNSLHLLIENIMVTYGETVYPFVPPLDYIYENGYYIGYNDGYHVGLEDAYAYDIGYDMGYKYGYNQGLEKGQSDDPYDLGDFIFSIIDAPFRIIREALNFEFLGYDVSKLVLFLITALLVVFVVKKLKGG